MDKEEIKRQQVNLRIAYDDIRDFLNPDKYYLGILKGINVAIAGQLDIDEQNTFLQSLHKFIKSEVDKNAC